MALSINQQLVLDAIVNDPGVTVEDIADETELTEGSVTRTLSRLVAQGLVLELGADWEARYVTKVAR